MLRLACSIEFDDKVVITGGLQDPETWEFLGIGTVSVYDVNGFVNYLPNMTIGRLEHGCGHYVNSNNKIVRLKTVKAILNTSVCCYMYVYNMKY